MGRLPPSAPRELIRPYPGALDGLRRLRHRGWTTAVVTNGLSDQQTTTLTGTGVADHVDACAISEAEGVKKPERRLFEIAADRCGAPSLHGGWMVGDSAIADICGGQDADLKTIWIDRGRPWPLTERRPDHSVGHITEAINFLMAWEARPGPVQPDVKRTTGIHTLPLH